MQPIDAYPVDLAAEYGDGTRSRLYAALGILWFPKALLLIPHALILWALGIASNLVVWIGYWVILFTGQIPDFFYRFPERVLAWNIRTSGWLLALTDDYPPFEWAPQTPHVDVSVTEPAGERSRGIALLGVIFLKPIALIPHVIVLVFVMLGAFLAAWIGFWAVLFTGRLPQGIFGFTVGAIRWNARIQAWMFSLTDRYPPFSLNR